MNSNKKKQVNVYRLVFTALLAAMVYVGTLIRIPLGESKIQLANIICLLGGFLLSPVDAGIAAGLGSALYDVTLGGYDAVGCLITFVSKFLMAFVCSALYRLYIRKTKKTAKITVSMYLIAAAGALLYVLLYMTKTFLMGIIVDGLTVNGVWVKMLAKLPASLINACAAVIVAPPLFIALKLPLDKAGVSAHLD